MNVSLKTGEGVYLEPPTIPVGMTIREYRRTRPARVRRGIPGVISPILSSR
jgi:hypothetical protein